MDDVMVSTDQPRGSEPSHEAAVERVVSFAQQFGEAHLDLAYHAAFPLALTPDLLYRIWANFVPQTAWTAVADVLLSRLCRESGYELYEMDLAVRNLLLKELKEDERFGQQRLNELADFLTDYVMQQLYSDDPDVRDLAQAQRWTALAYTRTGEAACELADALSELVSGYGGEGYKQEGRAKLIRVASLIDTFAEPLSKFGPLLVYARGMADFVRGDLKGAMVRIGRILGEESRPQVAGTILPVPGPIFKEIRDMHRQDSVSAQQVEAGISILIVDDNPDWRKTLRGLLADEGYQITTAEDEEEALAAAVQTSFDLAIIDVRLHGDAEDDQSGLSLAQGLKSIAPHLKVVLLTGYPARADQVVKSIRFFGVEDFIEKFSLGGSSGVDLVAMVKEILDKPSFGPGLDQLSLSFELGQPIVVRTRGAHVSALRTDKVCQLSLPIYNRRAQEARTAPDSRFNVKVIGRDLYRDVFENCHEVLVAFTEARAKRQPLCLSFEGARDLIGIPFEFTFLDPPAEYLILEHPVTRFINGVVPRRKALSPEAFTQLKGELRILIVASNTDPPMPGVDQEAQQLAEFLERQRYVNVRVNLIPTEEATITRVRRILRDCQAHIFHYAGHGSYDELSPEKSALFFWSKKNREGSVESMSAAMLKGLLQDSEVRFAYFSSCQGLATGSGSQLMDDDFLGIADAVVQAGVPSTLGFRWPVSDVGAPKLAKAFYGSLLRQGSPEIALWKARRELAGLGRDDPTWLSPILIHQV